MKVDRTGENIITNEGHEIEIVEWKGVEKCSIRFKCGLILKDLQYSGVKDGRIKYPFHRSVFGVGYFGIGVYFQKRGLEVYPAYNVWKNMIERCYSEKHKIKNLSYQNVIVCEKWHNFQNFAEWFHKNYNPETMKGWHLDKDILIKGNKVYSPDACCFVPPEINTLFISSKKSRGKLPIGVIGYKAIFRAKIKRNKKYEHIGLYNTPEEAFQAYKTAKELYIKEVADKWKDKISEKVYQAMHNYQVEITD